MKRGKRKREEIAVNGTERRGGGARARPRARGPTPARDDVTSGGSLEFGQFPIASESVSGKVNGQICWLVWLSGVIESNFPKHIIKLATF